MQVEIKPSSEGVSLTGLHLVFLIAMTLGFEIMVEGIYRYWRMSLGLENNAVRSGTLFFLPIMTMMLLGFRFLWATVNIRRYVDQALRVIGHEQTLQASQLRKSYERRILLFHGPLLIFHGFAYYLGAHLVADMLFESQPNHLIQWFIGFYIAYQLINVFWLWTLIKKFKSYSFLSTERESIWIKNNVVTSLVGIGALILLWKSGITPQVALISSCTAFGIGSFIDLYTTAYHYLESPDS